MRFPEYRAVKVTAAPPNSAHVERGPWPDTLAERHRYDIGQIKTNLAIFVSRFFHQSQFKRSCLPNGPKVGSDGSLSPGSDYRAPSDSETAP
jgi:NAD+ synthase (glutamine-hydrolysing)